MSAPKKTDYWAAWIARLSPSAQSAVSLMATDPDIIAPPTSDVTADGEEYFQWCKRLSPEAVGVLESLTSPPPAEDAITPGEFRYVMVEAEDGEKPILRYFRTLNDLTKRLAELDGDDVTVWPAFGVPLFITQGSPRYLLLPDGTAATLPTKGKPMTIIEASELDEPKIQDDGFLGPDDLVTSQRSSPAPRHSKSKVKVGKRDDPPAGDDVTAGQPK